MLTKQEVQILLRACQAEAGIRPDSATARDLVERFGFGHIVGRQWRLEAGDQERIRAFLRESEGIDPATPPDAWQARDRVGAAQLGDNEKLAGRGPRAGRLALRAPGVLSLDGKEWRLPPHAFLDLPADAAGKPDHDALILVENFEAFVRFEDADVDLPYPRPLLVYRGDRRNPHDAVLAFIRSIDLPVVAWPDLDPAGLLQSAALPGLTGILAPERPEECLTRQGRDDLYLNQLGQLDALSLNGESRALEQALRRARKGIDQERMIATRVRLRIWGSR